MISCKGYTGVIEIDEEASLLVGTVIGLSDVIVFQGESVKEARASFQKSIDFYLELCANQGKPPEEPFSGKILVRITPELHRVLEAEASYRRVGLNTLIGQTLTEAFPPPATLKATAGVAAKSPSRRPKAG